MAPCPGCGRLYGHLTGCKVELLHRELDEKIAAYGVQQVYVSAVVSCEEYVSKIK
jgi:hypothetical protein